MLELYQYASFLKHLHTIIVQITNVNQAIGVYWYTSRTPNSPMSPPLTLYVRTKLPCCEDGKFCVHTYTLYLLINFIIIMNKKHRKINKIIALVQH